MSAWTQLTTAATREVESASLALFRVFFGLLGFVLAGRFLANGWVQQFYVEPSYHFTFWGFEWVQVLSPGAMTLAFVALAIFSLMIAVGAFYRAATIGFFVLFTYIELIDVSTYLNHYYQLSLLALLLAFLPLHASYSVDAARSGRETTTHPAWMLWLLRFQVAVVYLGAAHAKLNADWLLHGQPLNIWLASLSETPLIGPYLGLWWVAVAMSWAGFLHDLLIVPALLHRRTRLAAYGVLVGFHVVTGYFFNIGMFPAIMILSATLFFEPGWPRTLLDRLGARRSQSTNRLTGPNPTPMRPLIAAALCLWVLFHIAMPLRAHVYQGDVSWHEQGMRWSWRVMLREKNGAVTYAVTLPSGKSQLVPPRRFLTRHQEREFAGQPDLILQLGQDIGRLYAYRHGGPVEVRVDAIVSLNGRPPAALIDPRVDLMAVKDGVADADWILPAPNDSPARLLAGR